MSTEDNDHFRPKLGSIRSRGNAKRYINRVLRAATLAGPGPWRGRSGGKSAFTGGRTGRGAGQGTVAAIRARAGTKGWRRVIVKARIVRLAGNAAGAARAHLRYIQRDGVTREGAPGRLYDAASDDADGKAFLARGKTDRHQFRFIVSPEDAVEMAELRPFVRDLMARMEEDLGTRLDWVAVDHYNTGSPHTHIVLRGKDDMGRDLVIARDYIAHGLRRRASELLTLELGPKTAQEIRRRLRREVDQERFTSLDRELLRDATTGLLDARREPPGADGRFRQVLRRGRLVKLQRMGLAEEVLPGAWRLAPELESTLRRLGERGDIVKAMHRDLHTAGLERSAGDYEIFDASRDDSRVVGRVVSHGLSDELHDRRYLVVDGLDGRAHYVDLGEGAEQYGLEPGAVIAVTVRPVAPGAADRVIAGIAAGSGGLYTAELHRTHDPGCSDEFVRAHGRRLEVLRRAGLVHRSPDGTWDIPGDFLDRARTYERQRRSRRPVDVRILSTLSVDRQTGAVGATWLDRQLVASDPEAIAGTGFGREFRRALDVRRRYLVREGLAEERDGRLVCRPALLRILRDRELRSVGAQLSRELGLPFVETADGGRVEGVYRRPVNLASGRFALIQTGRAFTLVPWRRVLERRRGQQVIGLVRGRAVSWSFGKSRGLDVE